MITCAVGVRALCDGAELDLPEAPVCVMRFCRCNAECLLRATLQACSGFGDARCQTPPAEKKAGCRSPSSRVGPSKASHAGHGGTSLGSWSHERHPPEKGKTVVCAAIAYMAIPCNVSLSSLLGGKRRLSSSSDPTCCSRCRSSRHWNKLRMRTPSFPALPRPSRVPAADRI